MTRIVFYFLGLCLFLPCLNATTSGRSRSLKPSAAENEPLNVRDFGAVGDGVADDGPAFQRAFDALAAAGGGTLLVPGGKYSIATPVAKDFSGLASSITIIGVESLTPVAPPSAPGSELSKGLDLQTEVYPRTGDHQVAFFFKGLRNLLIKDIAFVGTANVLTDAQITLSLSDIEKAQIKHSEFYGLCTLTGYGIVVAVRTDLEITQSKFLGSTATSGLYLPIVQNFEWYGITVSDTTFLDYGQRGELFSKTGIAAPISWINIGDAAPTTNVSPRREVTLRNVFFDEGGFWGLSSLPLRYNTQSAPIDLIYITGLEMNVSNFGQFGHLIYDAKRVFVEKSRYGWSHLAAAAISLNHVDSAILDQLTLEAAATRLHADSLTGELTVINTSYSELLSSAVVTNAINTAPEADPVQYVRSRFATVLGREPDPAAHYYWSDLLIHCFEDSVCQNSVKQALDDYLSHSPARTFKISGRIIKPNDAPVAGLTVTLSGSQSVTATTDGEGNYVFANLPTSGRYLVKPSANGFDFDSLNVITPSGDQVANFNAIPTYLVKGSVKRGGIPVPGATVSVSGSTVGTTLTESNGQYSFELRSDGDYLLTPSKPHYTFAPVSTSVNDLNADTQVDFTATLDKHSIAGRVLAANGSPVTGVLVTLAGPANATATTASDGSYSFTNLDAGASWTVTAAKDHYAFSPAVQTFNNLSANTVADFEAVPLSPILLTLEASDRAVALNLTEFLPEPFLLTTTLLTEGRNTTRIIVFASELGLLPGEDVEAITAEAEDSEHVVHQLRVEFVGPLSGLPNVNQVVIRLTRDLDGAGDVLIGLKVHGLQSNKARIAVGSVSDDPN